MVPIGLTTTGNVFCCAATTVTRGGTGSGFGLAVALQPEPPSTTAAAEAQTTTSRAAKGRDRSGSDIMDVSLRLEEPGTEHGAASVAVAGV